MPERKNLCAMIPLELHEQVSRAREAAGQTTSEYITLFQRIKAHLERETARTGRKLTQRDFVLGLIEAALNEAERQAGVGPCEGDAPEAEAQPPETT